MCANDRDAITSYLKKLRTRMIAGFEELEPSARFEYKPWSYSKGEGGGEIGLIRGDTFEKAAVNFSAVAGDRFPGESSESASGPFFATGVSLITHMRNPKAPTAHFNIRYIEAGDRRWLGGGFDLTPMGFPFKEDTESFHAVARKALEPWPGLYERFSKQAADYFFIPHYGRERGVGGIFFDHWNSGDLEADLRMWRSVGDHFLEAIAPIYKRRISESYSDEDRRIQLQRRGHYVEFNLLYDRGTKFGFNSGGNPEAILCSMPPLAAW